MADKGPLVAEWSRSIAAWIQANEKTVDLTIGVVIPIIVLFILQHSSRSTADGWNKISQLIEQTRQSGAKRQASAMPAIIVGGCLVACALLMFSLTVWNRQDQTLLCGFGAVQLLIAVVIFVFLSMKHRKPAVVKTPETSD